MISSYYTTHELAEMLNMGVRWVEKWRPLIVGARQVGRIWRFDKATIDARIAKGQDVRELKNLLTSGHKKYISKASGARRSSLKKGEKHGTN